MTESTVPVRRSSVANPEDLERALAAADPVPELRRLGDPLRLDLLFRLELRRRLRMGPAKAGRPFTGAPEASSIARLLGGAQQAAECGALPISTLVDSRTTLSRLEGELWESGAWSKRRPLWWQPLPASSPLEERWKVLESARSGLLQTTPAERHSHVAPSWRLWPSLLPTDLVERIGAELEVAMQVQILSLERGGVGAGGRIEPARTDEVAHLSGLEPALLGGAPLVAALIQWLRVRLAPNVFSLMADPWSSALARRPEAVMLARHGPGTRGYAPHYDNPGGESDNGRALTLVLYLTSPSRPCRGGELAFWHQDTASGSPSQTISPRGGGLVTFASREVLHEVRPLQPGPARWSLVTWMKDDTPTLPPSAPAEPTLEDVMVPLDDPPLPRGTVAFHALTEDTGSSRIHLVRPRRRARPMRLGVVATVAESERALDRWITYHLDLGVAHLVVVLDGPRRADKADFDRLSRRYSTSNVTVWSSARLAEERWEGLAVRHGLLDLLHHLHHAESSTSLQSVAARQTINASTALEAARTDELGGAPLDWLLHVDADELLHLEGAGRGGASLQAHLASAGAAGWSRMRYLDHELLLPQPSTGPALFKVNPLLAAARLGKTGWTGLKETLHALRPRRPYFHGYSNGKTAVAVKAAAAAAGIHDWRLQGSSLQDAGYLLAGPSILHCRLPGSDDFCTKMLGAAGSIGRDGDLFEPSAVEQLAFSLVTRGHEEGWDVEKVRQQLTELYLEVTHWSEGEQALLHEAGLLLAVDLRRPARSGVLNSIP